MELLNSVLKISRFYTKYSILKLNKDLYYWVLAYGIGAVEYKTEYCIVDNSSVCYYYKIVITNL